MWNYMCIRWLRNWSDSTKMHGATIRFIVFRVLIYIGIGKIRFVKKYEKCKWQKLLTITELMY